MKIYYGHREEYFDKYFDSVQEGLIPTVEVDTYKDGVKWMNKKLKDQGINHKYSHINFSQSHNWVEIDYGSWSTFFLFFELSEEDWKEFIG